MLRYNVTKNNKIDTFLHWYSQEPHMELICMYYTTWSIILICLEGICDGKNNVDFLYAKSSFSVHTQNLRKTIFRFVRYIKSGNNVLLPSSHVAQVLNWYLVVTCFSCVCVRYKMVHILFGTSLLNMFSIVQYLWWEQIKVSDITFCQKTY